MEISSRLGEQRKISVRKTMEILVRKTMKISVRRGHEIAYISRVRNCREQIIYEVILKINYISQIFLGLKRTVYRLEVMTRHF